MLRGAVVGSIRCLWGDESGAPMSAFLVPFFSFQGALMPCSFQGALATYPWPCPFQVVGSIRRVLAPVLLRRLKDEVAEQLMAKRHYVDMVDMTERQRSVYEEASDKIRRR